MLSDDHLILLSSGELGAFLGWSFLATDYNVFLEGVIGGGDDHLRGKVLVTAEISLAHDEVLAQKQGLL